MVLAKRKEVHQYSPEQIPYFRIDQDHELAIYTKIDQLPVQALNLLEHDDRLLSKAMFQFTEAHPPAGFQFFYLGFYKDRELMGLMPYQLFQFSGQKHVQSVSSDLATGWWKNTRSKVLDWVVDNVDMRILVGGTMLFTGDYSFVVQASHSPTNIFDLIDKGVKHLTQHLKNKGLPPHIFVQKDVPEAYTKEADTLLEQGYAKSPFSPAMRLALDPSWLSFEDYLAALSSKYRVRAKRAKKKATSVAVVELGLAEIEMHQSTLYELYKNVVTSSSFNVLDIPSDFFLGFKKAFPDRYRIFAYFQEGVMIGFFSTLTNGTTMEAHYLGFDTSKNRAHQLYLNMLYEIIRVGLEERVSLINYARTSLEIKSSVGAKPHKMWCYYKHRNPLVQALLPSIINRYSQEESWVERHPFKQ
ncbi:MAG: hypothetical protein AAF798_22600 [Bacteroidota bacterium]